MAQTTLTTDLTRRSALDRPLLPSWERLASLAAYWEVALYALFFVAAFTLRIWDVGSRALHHDESLHAYYSWLFYVGRGYAYDPLMHGPFQFEVVPLFYTLFGDSEFSARLLAVLLGTLMIPVPYFLRSYITRPGALVASAGIAISPSMVYFSRFIRDDIYLAFFSLVTFACLVGYLQKRRPWQLYVASAAMALAIASMEAAYLTAFIFGAFFLVEGIREYLTDRSGPVLRAIKSTSLDTWLTALSIFVVILVLLYSTFFTNPYGIWDTRATVHSLLDPNRKDILGGLTYWKAQHTVQRGGQPWFYYFLTLALYEQIALVLGVAGMVTAVVRRSLARTFLVWWAVMSWGLYSWAGEKMPWLTIHTALPLILLAGLFVGEVLRSRRTWAIALISVAAGIFALVEIHSTFVLNFQDGANPTELLVYVQTSQDVPTVANEVKALSKRVTGGNTMKIGLDNTDVGGWPFSWYLRDYPNVTETSNFAAPACGGQLCPAMIMLSPEFDSNSAYLLKHYVVQKYRWNWWFPEDYKMWFPQHWNLLLDALHGTSTPGQSWWPTRSEWSGVWNWLLYRTPFGDRGARWMYFLVQRNLVPNAKDFSQTVPGVVAPTPIAIGPTIGVASTKTFGTTGALALAGPRGIAAAPDGTLFVADGLNHRVIVYSPSGKAVTSWGTVGTAPGQFSKTDSPQGVAIGPDGLVYVADTWNQRIQVFTKHGTFVRSWGSGLMGSKSNQFYGPRSLAVSADGRVYVADTGNKRIQVFDSRGHYIATIGSAGSQQGQFNEPSSVVAARDGKVYVADYWNRRIQVYSPSGTFLRSWPVPDWQSQNYDEPYLALDSKGQTIFAADPSQQRVLEYTTTGRLVGTFRSDVLTVPIGVSVLPSGQVVVGDTTAHSLTLFRLSGVSPSRKSHGKPSPHH